MKWRTPYELLLDVVLEACVAWSLCIFRDRISMPYSECNMRDEGEGDVKDDTQVSDLSKWYNFLMVKSIMR